jgi:hypothetical protein
MTKKNASKESKPSKKKKNVFLRLITWVVGVVIVLLVAIILIVQFALSPVVKTTASKLGPSVIGAPISISNVNIKAFSGLVDISGLVVGPPEQFKANLFQINNFKVQLDAASLLTDTIVIKEIKITDPVVTYELSGIKSNFGRIMEKLEGDKPEKEDKPKEAKSKTESGKKVVIESFVFEGAKVRMASTITGGKGVVLPMPRIELSDIGAKHGGATGVEAFSEILKSIVLGVFDVIGDLGGAVLGTAGVIGEGALDATGAVGGAALDAASGAVGKVGGALGGLLGRGDKKEKEAEKE